MRRIDLSGEWKLVQWQGKATSRPAAVPMQIPGDNLSALLRAGRIPDPYFGCGELEALWAGKADWLLYRTVVVEPEFLEGRNVFLHFDSLDTVAEIRINGRLAGRSSNMFTALRIDVGKTLRAGENLLEILLRSPEKRAQQLSRRLPYPVPHSLYPVQSPHRNLLRKVQCHSGWDWGPCLMVSGIYGRAFVGSCRLGRIDCVSTEQSRRGESWELSVTVEYFAYASGKAPLEISIAGQGVARSVELEAGENTVREKLEVHDPLLWWPSGYGKPDLYELTVQVGEDRIRKEIGFRTIELLREKDRAGSGMTFAVNGRKIFCKGANWIPPDALPGRQAEELYRRLLSDVAAANMNMLRVWGGGQYETDLFYRLCDRMGVLVWQDLMFSCSTYPATDWFLQEAAAEVRHQVRRLKDHACIALWCGNNENLGALNWYAESRAHAARYVVDYDRLNEGVVGRLVRELDPGRPWWPSSPSAGPGDYSDNWHNDRKGDMHYWSVWHEGRGFEAYYEVTPRFCSEFGFQSFPSLQTVRNFAPREQWNVSSPVMEHHQRHPRGNTLILQTMSRYFRMPESFESFLYLSQVQQAVAMKTAVEYWRSRRPVCMGALYWQLNDVWPAVSWSSIEYSGKWKLLHYAARKFYAPVHAAAFCADGQELHVVGLNDTAEPWKGTLRVRLIDFGGVTHREHRQAVLLNPEAATVLSTWRLEELPLAKERIFLLLELSSKLGGRSARSGQQPVLRNELFLCPPKRCELAAAEIHRRIRAEERQIVIELRTNLPAFYVALDWDEVPGVFDDNLFTLLPGEAKTVRFLPRPEAEPEKLEDMIRRGPRLFHLRGSYGCGAEESKL